MPGVKRKATTGGYGSRKRPRLVYRRTKKRRFVYRKRRYRRTRRNSYRRRGRGGYKLPKGLNTLPGFPLPAVDRSFYLPPYLVKAMTIPKYLYGTAEGFSSVLTNNPLMWRFHPSLYPNLNYQYGPQGNWTSASNPGGPDAYTPGWADMERYFLVRIEHKLVVTQLQENARVRIQYVVPKKSLIDKGLGYPPTDSNSGYPTHPLAFANNLRWRVLRSKTIQYNQPLNDTNQTVMVFNFTQTFNKWFRCPTLNNPASVADWNSDGWQNYGFLMICTDDQTDLDTSMIQFNHSTKTLFYPLYKNSN